MAAINKSEASASESPTYDPFVGFDTRSVAISGLEPTYHKDPNTGQQVQNLRASSGFMAADTLAPDASSSSQITYNPVYDYSTWGNGSQYDWKSADGTGDMLGTFKGGIYTGIPSFPVPYNNPPTVGGSNDYITLTLTDPNDGAVATNNYSVLFHDEYEQWNHATDIERHPIALTGGFNDPHPDWTYLMTIDNGGSEPLTQNLSQSLTLSETESGTIGGGGSLDVEGIASFQANESITVGDTLSYTYTTSTTRTGAPHTITQFYGAMSWEYRSGGTVDIYAANGFQGTSPWEGIWSSGQVSPGEIEIPHP